MKEDNCVKDGEIQLLRDNLKKKDSELDGLKAEKVNQIYQHNLQQGVKEKSLQVIQLMIDNIYNHSFYPIL